jgi:hypothetical protein
MAVSIWSGEVSVVHGSDDASIRRRLNNDSPYDSRFSQGSSVEDGAK